MAKSTNEEFLDALAPQGYEYGLPDRASKDLGIVSQISNLFQPFRSPVIKQPTTEYVDVIDGAPGEKTRVQTEGEYGEPEFGLSYMPIVQGIMGFASALKDDPAAVAKAVGEGIAQIPEDQIKSAIGLSRGYDFLLEDQRKSIFEPENFREITYDPSLVPAAMAAGTVVSTARLAGNGSTILGMMGGSKAKTGSARMKTAQSLRSMGKSKEDIFRANMSYFDSDIFPSDFEAFRFEIPTTNTKLKFGDEYGSTPGETPLGQQGSSLKDFLRISPEDGLFGVKKDVMTYRTLDDGRVQLDDMTAKFPNGKPDYGRSPVLADIIDFPELFEEYPELKDLRIARLESDTQIIGGQPMRTGAFYTHEGILGKPTIAVGDATDSDDFLENLLHEVQHAIQAIERAPEGGAVFEIYDQLMQRAGRNTLDSDGKFVLDEEIFNIAMKQYYTLYGEVEANMVMQRFRKKGFDRAINKSMHPLDLRKKNVADTDVSLDELDAVDRAVDEKPEIFDQGVASFGPGIAAGVQKNQIQESRRTGGVSDEVLRKLKVGAGGIRGLAHGVTYTNKDSLKQSPESIFVKNEDLASDMMLEELGEKYRDPDKLKTGVLIPRTELVKAAGFDNVMRESLTGAAAASSEVKRLGFSLSYDPMMSFTKFAGDPGRRGGAFRDPSALLVAYPNPDFLGGITVDDIHNLSPAQYLMTSYPADKMALKKPNSRYFESEVHIGGENILTSAPGKTSSGVPRNQERGLKDLFSVRDMTDGELLNLVRISALNDRAYDNIQDAVNAIRDSFDARGNNFQQDFGGNMRKLHESLESTSGAAAKDAAANESIYYLGQMVRGEGEFKGKGNITDAFLRPQVGKFDRAKLEETYGTAVADDFIQSLSEYTRLADIGKGEAFMHDAVKKTSTTHYKKALDEVLPDGTEKYFSVQSGNTLEFELPFDMRQLLSDLEISEIANKANPSPANKARYNEIQNKLRQDPGHKFFTYETPDGNLAVVSDELGNALHTVEGQGKVNGILQRLKRVRDGEMTVAAFEEEAARSTPGSIYPLIMDLAKQQDRITKGYLHAIDNSEVGKKFNQLHRDIQKAEKRALKAIEDIALLHPDNVVKNMSRERRAAFDVTIDKDVLRDKVGEYISRPTAPFKNISVRDNPAVKFKHGGPVKAGIAQFIKHMQ